MEKRVILVGVMLFLVNTLFGAISTVVNGDWGVGATWGGSVPATNADAEILHSITVSSNQTIKNLVFVGGSITIENGDTLTVTGSISDNGSATINIDGGGVLLATSATFDVVGTAVVSVGVFNVVNDLNLTSATFTNSGTLAVGGNLKVDNGEFTNDGTVNVTGYGQFDNDPDVDNNGTMDFYGELDINTTGVLHTIENSGGVINAHGGVDMTGSSGCITNGTVNYWGDFEPGTCNIGSLTLPVTLTEFYGKQLGQEIELYWATESEEENDMFVIERSLNGISFVSVGEVNGVGYSSARVEYNFVDNSAENGLNYYRLKQVDFDQTETFFSAITIDFNAEEPIVSPTIAPQGSLVSVSNVSIGSEVALMDVSSGKVITVAQGDGEINTGQIAKSVYYLVVDQIVTSVKISVY